MSEYWVSKKKYYCKYCEIYITDDGPSRQQHENGLRHKGNRDRFIRGLYKDGEKKKKDLEEEKREMARVEMAAQAAFSQDVGAGRAKAVAPVVSSTTSKKPPQKPSNPFANYSTAASLGFTDPDAERISAEQERHRTQGVAGEWQVVEPSSQLEPEQQQPEDGPSSLKRPAETLVDEEDTRHFKLRKKTLGTGLGEIYDPGILTLKPKTKLALVGEQSSFSVPSSSTTSTAIPNPSENAPKATNVPKWSKLQWKRPGEQIEKVDRDVQESVDDAEDEKKPLEEARVKEEKDDGLQKQTEATGSRVEPKGEPSGDDPALKAEPTEPPIPPPANTGLFRKRKAPATSGGRRQPT